MHYDDSEHQDPERIEAGAQPIYGAILDSEYYEGYYTKGLYEVVHDVCFDGDAVGLGPETPAVRGTLVTWEQGEVTFLLFRGVNISTEVWVYDFRDGLEAAERDLRSWYEGRRYFYIETDDPGEKVEGGRVEGEESLLENT